MTRAENAVRAWVQTEIDRAGPGAPILSIVEMIADEAARSARWAEREAVAAARAGDDDAGEAARHAGRALAVAAAAKRVARLNEADALRWLAPLVLV